MLVVYGVDVLAGARVGPAAHIDAIAIADAVGTANQKQLSTSTRPSFGSKELDNRFDEKTTKTGPRGGRCLDSGEAPSERQNKRARVWFSDIFGVHLAHPILANALSVMWPLEYMLAIRIEGRTGCRESRLLPGVR